MQHIAYIVSTTIHIIAATIWVGSLIFMSLILVPALRSMKDPALMTRLIQGVGRRYKWIGWMSLILLLLTGYLNLHFRGITMTMLGNRDFWNSAFGETLAWKLILFAVVLVLSLLHDTVIGPGSRARLPGGEMDLAKAARYRKLATFMGRLTLILSILIVILAVMLVRGRPW